MYCSECGNKAEEEAIFCSKCRRRLGEKSSCKQKTNAVAVVGFAFSFIFGLIGLICSVIGYRKADLIYGGSYKRLALAGIMISEITITWQITFISIIVALRIIATM